MSKVGLTLRAMLTDRYGSVRAAASANWHRVLFGFLSLWLLAALLLQNQRVGGLAERLDALEKADSSPASATISSSPRVAPALGGPLVPPVASGTIVRHYGWTLDPARGEWHYRTDVVVQLPRKAEVRAIAGGQITSVGQEDGAASLIIGHGDGLTSEYWGLGDLVVKQGERVAKGQALAVAQMLRLQIRRHNQAQNPELEITWPTN